MKKTLASLRALAHRAAKGFTLIEVLIVALALGIFAAIALPAYSNAMTTVKVNSFATSISDMQAASDNFDAQTAAFPTYSGSTVGNQPITGSYAAEINYTAADNNGNLFYPSYVRVPPDTVLADNGIQGGAGRGMADALYYGVTATGAVFATQVEPSTGPGWAVGTTYVYTQSSVRQLAPSHYTGVTGPGMVELGTIWGA